jgi:uncharacterized protein YkwD
MTTTPTPARLRRTLAAALLSAALVGAPALTATADASVPDAGESTTRVMNRNQEIVVGQVNRTRTNNRRRSLATNGLMNRRAMKWAAHLVACQCLEHRAAPFGTPAGWCGAAENIGRSGNGGTLGGVHNAFLNSPSHRANILNRRWTALGVGIARDRAGEYFVVQAFADFSC